MIRAINDRLKHTRNNTSWANDDSIWQHPYAAGGNKAAQETAEWKTVLTLNDELEDLINDWCRQNSYYFERFQIKRKNKSFSPSPEIDDIRTLLCRLKEMNFDIV